jgi:hypothetical protein
MYRMKTLAERKVKTHEAMNYFLKVICNTDQHSDLSVGLTNERALKKVQMLYEGHGRGAEMHAAKDTAWALLCAVTEFVDHEKQARSQDNRLDSAGLARGCDQAACLGSCFATGGLIADGLLQLLLHLDCFPSSTFPFTLCFPTEPPSEVAFLCPQFCGPGDLYVCACSQECQSGWRR